MNEKRWNGKVYTKDGIIEFEIKEGNEKSKEYDFSCKLIFEGEYINGKRNGKGI